MAVTALHLPFLPRGRRQDFQSFQYPKGAAPPSSPTFPRHWAGFTFERRFALPLWGFPWIGGREFLLRNSAPSVRQSFADRGIGIECFRACSARQVGEDQRGRIFQKNNPPRGAQGGLGRKDREVVGGSRDGSLVAPELGSLLHQLFLRAHERTNPLGQEGSIERLFENFVDGGRIEGQ